MKNILHRIYYIKTSCDYIKLVRSTLREDEQVNIDFLRPALA